MKTAAQDIEGIYNNLSKIDKIDDENVSIVHDGLRIIRINTLNLQITICNRHYGDIMPICNALDQFISNIETDIDRAE